MELTQWQVTVKVSHVETVLLAVLWRSNCLSTSQWEKFIPCLQPMRETITQTSLEVLVICSVIDIHQTQSQPDKTLPQCSCWCQLQSQWVSLKRMGRGKNGLNVTQPMATSQLEPSLYPHNITKQYCCKSFIFFLHSTVWQLWDFITSCKTWKLLLFLWGH